MIGKIIAEGKSIRYYSLLSWFIPTLVVALSSISIFLGLTYVNYSTELKKLTDQSIQDTKTISRRVSAELLLGQRGSATEVAENLKNDFQFDHIEISTKKPECLDNELLSCSLNKENQIYSYSKIPYIDDQYFIQTVKSTPNFLEFTNLWNLLLITLPIAALLGLGVFFQRSILKKYIFNPIHSLVDTTKGKIKKSASWAKELQDISEKLSLSFQNQENEIYTKFSDGVIHDLRTLINSPLISLELLKECEENNEKRDKILENLALTCSKQLPKMKDIIERALDLSREIKLEKKNTNLQKPLSGSIETLKEYSEKLNAKIIASENLLALKCPHDPLQLERALTNLIKNGLEATSETKSDQGNIVSVNFSENQNEIEIHIEDSGSGFTRDFQSESNSIRSSKIYGSGIGFIVSRKIVEAHGGRIILGRSEKLGGAKVSIRLPKENEASHG